MLVKHSGHRTSMLVRGVRPLPLLTVTIISRYHYKSIVILNKDIAIFLYKIYIDIAIYMRYNDSILEEVSLIGGAP